MLGFLAHLPACWVTLGKSLNFLTQCLISPSVKGGDGAGPSVMHFQTFTREVLWKHKTMVVSTLFIIPMFPLGEVMVVVELPFLIPFCNLFANTWITDFPVVSAALLIVSALQDSVL